MIGVGVGVVSNLIKYFYIYIYMNGERPCINDGLDCSHCGPNIKVISRALSV